jgi:hypothetical protein
MKMKMKSPKSSPFNGKNGNGLHSLSNMPFSADLISFEEITDYSLIRDKKKVKFYFHFSQFL